MELKDFFFTESHEWVQIKDGIATIGVTDYAQRQLGDIVYVGVKSPDTEIAAGENFGSIESVKTLSDLICPITGQITEINTQVAVEEDSTDEPQAPETINEKPYEDGWIIKLKVGDVSNETDQLMDSEKYNTYVESL